MGNSLTSPFFWVKNMTRRGSILDYVVDLQRVVDELNQMIADLEGNTTLEAERDGLATARDHVRAVLNSFKRLKGIR